ncbi:MAG TPA: HAMP domain-containing sensor histidine kinase [Kofleriaceae bacterium]
MSLRSRLLVVATLAIVALATAIVTVLQLVDDRASRELAEAHSSDHAALAALAAGGGRGTHDDLRVRAAAIFAPIADTRGGYCWSDGSFVESASIGVRGLPPDDFGDNGAPPGPPPDRGGPPPRHDGPPPDHGPPHGHDGPLPPPVRAALEIACKSAISGATVDRDVVDRGEVFAFAVRGIEPGVAAFAIRTVSTPRDTRWPPALGVIALATLLVIALNLHALVQLRRGAAQLADALARLEVDPRAVIERPATRELADVAGGVQKLAGRLADARARELELERERNHARRMSSLGHLVAGIAHEVRNPLTGIKLLLDGIRRREGDAKTKTDVDTALREVARLDKLVAACLGVARDSGVERTELELGGLVDERLAVLGAHAGARGVKLVRRGSSTRLADRDAIVRIVDNLVRNAIDASPDGAAIEVAIDGATIDVIDCGPGVPEGQILFEPFVTSKPDGTGLGLWMSLALAEARGGTLRYRRADGMTHFTVELGPA